MSMRPHRCSTSRAAPSSPPFPSSPSSAPATARRRDRNSRASLRANSGSKASSLPRTRAGHRHRRAPQRTRCRGAGGIAVVYPPENAELQETITERSLLISERSAGFSPRGKDFPQRNRLISGISLGAWWSRRRRSGSLITRGLPANRDEKCSPCPAVRSIHAPRHQQSPEARRLPRHLFARYRRDARADPGTPASRVRRSCLGRRALPPRPFLTSVAERRSRRSARAQSSRYRRADPRHRNGNKKGPDRAARTRSAGRLQRHGHQLVSPKSPQT